MSDANVIHLIRAWTAEPGPERERNEAPICGADRYADGWPRTEFIEHATCPACLTAADTEHVASETPPCLLPAPDGRVSP